MICLPGVRFDWMTGVKGLAIIILIGVALRLAVAPLLTYDYDIYHWGVIIENIRTGNGLYGMAGYYYTPVWGYFLGTESVYLAPIESLDSFGYRYEEMLGIEAADAIGHTATVTTTAFNVAMKVPLILVDAVTAYLIFTLIRDLGGDDRKACIGAAIWMLGPLVIYMSGIQAMFDPINGMLMILVVLLLIRGYRFLPGVLFSIAALLKFFPLFAIFVLLAYVVYKGRERGTAPRDVLLTILGAGIAAFAIYIPEILDGTFMDSLSFMLARAGNSDVWYILNIAIGACVALGGMICFSYMMWRKPGADLDKGFIICTTGVLLCAVCLSTTAQYVLVVLPLLIVCAMAYDGRLKKAAIIVAIGGLFAAAASQFPGMLVGASVNLGLMDPATVVDWIYDYTEPIIGNESIFTIGTNLGNIFEYAGIVLALVIILERPLRRILFRGRAAS